MKLLRILQLNWPFLGGMLTWFVVGGLLWSFFIWAGTRYWPR